MRRCPTQSPWVRTLLHAAERCVVKCLLLNSACVCAAQEAKRRCRRCSEAGRAVGVCVCGAAGHPSVGCAGSIRLLSTNSDSPVAQAAPARAAQAQSGAVGAEGARATESAYASQRAPACAGTCLLPCTGRLSAFHVHKAPTLGTLCALWEARVQLSTLTGSV